MTLWYITRATGVVALVLLTVTVALGVANVKRFHTRRIPRFVVNGVHRNASLLAVSFLVAHVVSTIADGYVPVHVLDAVVPFLSGYHPFWVGLGTVGVDLLAAVMVTSLLRRRFSRRAWRATHWLAYVSWPVALMHSLGTGADAGSGWMLIVAGACVAAVAVAVTVRLRPAGSSHERQPGRLAGNVESVGGRPRQHPVAARRERQARLESPA
jgi:sulfoxide reductase heme-binding subunit YedZ